MSAWRGRRVLVTGAGGFIGSHLAERLAQAGARTRALVRYTAAGTWGWLEESPAREELDVVAGDVRDRDTLQRAVEGVEVVFHLAALIGIPYSYHAPESYVRTNVEGTLNVLREAQRSGVGLVVQTSTSEVYGTAQTVPMDEGHPLQAQSPYAASKIGADHMALAFHRSHGLPVAVVRPFNTFGPRQSSRAIIPTVITQALAAPEIRLGDTATTRDFTYVADTVEGFLRVAECGQAVGQVVNLGTGRETSVGQVVAAVLELVGRRVPIVEDPQRLRPEQSEVDRLCADAARAKAWTGWQARWDLRQGLGETVEWFRAHQERSRVGSYAV